MAYITLAEIKAYVGIPTATTTDDVILTSFIASAQAAIDAYCHRTFEAAADAERTFDAIDDTDGATLYVDEICSITSITNGDGVVVAADEYVTEPRRVTPYYAIKLLASSSKSWTYDTDHEDAITVDGKWAFSTAAGNDIKQACLRLTAWMYRQRDTNAEVDRPIFTEAGVILPSAIPSDVKALLNPYRKLL